MVGQIQITSQPIRPVSANQDALIEPRDIKAILYLGLRGEVVLPDDSRKVDILA